MSKSLQQLGIDLLSREERLELLGEIWDSLTPELNDEIPESHREELDRRIALADANPQAGKPWHGAVRENMT